MFLHRSLLGVMAKTFFENSPHNFTRRVYRFHFTNEVTAECSILATTAVKHFLDNWVGGGFFRVVFEVNTYNCM